MLSDHTVWFAFNQGSGSNSDAALAEIDAAFARAGCTPARRISFPDDDAPTARDLEEAGVDILAIFAGDGTINSLVTGLKGWSGAVLALPGGTMNLLAARMHGEASAPEILDRVASGKARKVRPPIIRCRHGDGLTGMLAGPGTAWNNVREALREADVVGVVTSTTEAIGESTGGPAVVCREPQTGRAEGYAAIMLSPHEDGIELDGFYADNVSHYLQQGLALLRRNFRLGPHEELGTFRKFVLASTENSPIGLLIDGEPAREVDAEESFELARCGVDLLETIETAAE